MIREQDNSSHGADMDDNDMDDNPGNFADDREKASEAGQPGKMGGQSPAGQTGTAPTKATERGRMGVLPGEEELEK